MVDSFDVIGLTDPSSTCLWTKEHQNPSKTKKALVWCRVSSCRLTSAACSSAERRGCCSHAWLLLYLWPTFLIVPSLSLSLSRSALARPPAATHRPTLPFLYCGPGPAVEGGLKMEPVFISERRRGETSRRRPASTWPPARPSSSHIFHLLFSFLQDVKNHTLLPLHSSSFHSQSLFKKKNICYIIKAQACRRAKRHNTTSF